MSRVIGVVFCFMILVTVGVAGTIAYRVGFEEGKLRTEEASLVKYPFQYGVWKAFSAERVEIEPVTWRTVEELGVVFIKSEHSDRYWVYIVNGQEDRALAWMRESHVPYVVKQGDEFYEIGFLWVTPGISTSAISNSLGALLLLSLGWAIFGTVAYSKRSERKPKVQ